MGKNGKEIRAKYDLSTNEGRSGYRCNSLRNFNPSKEMSAHMREMQSDGHSFLTVKTNKGGLRLTNASLNKRGKRIRPDVIQVLNKHTAKQVQSAIGGLPKAQAKNARRLKNQRNFKKLMKTLSLPVGHGTIVNKVRRPDRYIFALESKGGKGGRTKQ